LSGGLYKKSAGFAILIEGLTAKKAKNTEREAEFLTAKYAEYTKRGRELGIL